MNDSNKKNKLLYNPDEAKHKRLQNLLRQENPEEDEELDTQIENEEDIESNENSDFEEETIDESTNANNIEGNENTQVNNRKTNFINKVENVGNKVKKTADLGNLISKIALFITKYPYVLPIIGGVFIVLFIILILSSGSEDGTTTGYYDEQCNFNETVVALNTCDTSETTNMPLKNYIIGTTYTLAQDNNYSDETIKAIMIILKTNALSIGNYNSSSMSVSLNDCSIAYTVSEENDELYTDLTNLYSEIENYLYVSKSYTSQISSLSNSNILDFSINDVSQIESLANSGNDYESILNELYNDGDVSEELPDENENVTNINGTIFVGDSRTQGMLLAGATDSNNTVYGVGYGYNWFIGNGTFSADYTNATSGALTAVNSKIRNGRYNIVIWLGVNDYRYYTAQDYYNKYYELATGDWSNHNIYVVKVGPVDDNLATSVNNEGINNFNNEMANLINNSNANNLHYIEINYSIQNYDSMGLHYGSSDYVNIKKQIDASITTGGMVLSNQYALYNLTDYCTYYVTTANESYWWPIGSKDATNGNIYGGTPSSVTVSSPYGPRTIQGISSYHKGIDISATCNDNVVVATKAGTVTQASDTCPSYGEYQNNCGGGYGNYVIIDHGDGTSSVYAHMYSETVSVSVGDKVEQGQKLGMVGSSGSSTGCHLHFEIRVNDSQVDPLQYVSADNPRPVLRDISIDAGSNNEGGQQVVCQALLASGFSQSATAAIMVNINAESGFRTNAVEYGSGYTIDNIEYASGNEAAGFGLFQWSYGRRINIINYLNSNGYSLTSLQGQLEYFVQELNTSYVTVKKYVTGNYSVYDIANVFCQKFEVPYKYKTNCPIRAQKYSEQFEKYVKNGCN